MIKRKISVFVIFILLVGCLYAQQPTVVLPVGHNDVLYNATFFKKGKRIITASKDGTAKIWDAQNGQLLHTLSAHNANVYTATFSSNETLIVTASADKTAIIWDALTMQPIHKLIGHTNQVCAATFIGNNQRVLTISFDGTAKIWDVKTGKIIFNLVGHTKPIESYDISPNEQFLATGSLDNTAIIWNLLDGTIRHKITGYKERVSSLKFAPNNQSIVISSWDKSAIIWDVATAKAIHQLPHKEGVLQVIYTPNGNEIITRCFDNETRVWNASTGEMIQSFKGNTSSFIAAQYVTVSLDGKLIAIASEDKTVKVWRLKTAELITTLKGHTDLVKSISFSSNGKNILTASIDKTAKIWNTTTGAMVADLIGKSPLVTGLKYSPNGSIIAAGFTDNTARVWNLYSGVLVSNLIGHKDEVNCIAFSKNGKKVITGSYDKTAIVWQAENGSRLLQLKGHTFDITEASFSNNMKKIVTASLDKSAIIWDAETGILLHKLIGHKQGVLSAVFSPDDKLIATASRDSSIIIWNTVTGSLITSFKKYHGRAINVVTFSKDGKMLASCSDDRTSIIWDLQTGTVKTKLTGHTADVTYVAFMGDEDEMILTASADNTIKIWNTQSGECLQTFDFGGKVYFRDISLTFGHIVSVANSEIKVFDIRGSSPKLVSTIYALGANEYLNLLPNGYYQTTNNAVKMLHYVTKDFKTISFNQLDVKYNRPDKVLRAMGNQNELLIASYQKAYEKRIKKLGIDTTQFKDGYSVPESDFINRDAIEYEQTKNKLLLKIKCNDSTYKLDRFNIWVNEVPLFGLKGISISKKSKNSFDTTLTINLSQGENRIETSIANVNGTESYRMPLFVRYTPTVPKEAKLHFIGIGINQFANPDYNLNWSVKDIRDLSFKLKNKYPNIIIDTLFDDNVTKENILALKKKLLLLNEDDKVIVSYSGHGVLSKDFDYFLSTYKINFNIPEEQGLAYDDLESLLDNIKPRQKLMLIDACHSGEVDKDELLKIEQSKSALEKSGTTINKGVSIIRKKENKNLGMANSFELMQSLFVNVGKGTGATIISAAGGMQYAQERGDLKNGVFTYSIIEAFNSNSSLKISELKKIVGDRVTQLTNGLQKPTSRNETNNYDWVIW